MALLNGARSRRLVRAGHLAIALCMLAAFVRAGDLPRPSSEYQLKAVFLYNFAQFADWPAAAFHDPAAPLVIGILGDDPFGAYLDELVRDEKVSGHALAIRRYREVAEARDCHILFISRSETKRLPAVIAAMRGQPVLTISDADAFARLGGMVRFVTEGGKVRLRVNVEAAKAAKVTISSKILRAATIVVADKD